MNVFDYFIIIRFIPNYATHFHNILETLSFKHIKNIYNFSSFLTLKFEKPNTNYTFHGSLFCECIPPINGLEF
jgi:hypothetical protein